MKRFFAIFVTALMLVSAMSLAVSADDSFDTGKAVFDIPEAAEISFGYTGVTGVTLVPQKGGSLESLIDGDAVSDAGAFDTNGVVLVRNDYIKPTYEAQKGQAVQSVDAIPVFSFTLKYEEKTTFDALYISLFQEINHMVMTPGNNQVVVEISENGKDWTNVDTYYFRPHIVEYTGDQHAGSVDELIVPLGKEIKSTYVRMSFDFALVPETLPPHYWTYYSNVYEWSGFTELGVAKYKSGEAPSVMTEEQANTPDVVVDGTWVTKSDELATVYKFDAGTVEKTVYGIEDFEEAGMESEVISEETGTYEIYINDVTVTIADSEVVYSASISEDGKLTLDDKFEPLVLEPYSDKPSANDSSAPSADPDGDDDDDDDDDDNNGIDYSKPVANNGAADNSTNGSDDGISPLVIVGIVAAVLAVVAVVVVVIIVLKKKKQ